METLEKMPRRQMSRSAIFAAGTLVGAIAAFVPFASLGHPRSRAEHAETSAAASASPGSG